MIMDKVAAGFSLRNRKTLSHNGITRLACEPNFRTLKGAATTVKLKQGKKSYKIVLWKTQRKK